MDQALSIKKQVPRIKLHIAGLFFPAIGVCRINFTFLAFQQVFLQGVAYNLQAFGQSYALLQIGPP